MKRIGLILFLITAVLSISAQTRDKSQTAEIVLTPYVDNDAKTPSADKILLDKLTRIVTKYGMGASNGLQSPFIITGHAVELKEETTATVPPHTVLDISLTIYVGNGEDGNLFSSCNMTLRGVGDNLDQAYVAAFKRINLNDPEIARCIEEGKSRIAKYYSEAGPGLIRQAQTYSASGNYPDAYAVLLRIPSVCPQYKEAQGLLQTLVAKESESNNEALIARARAAWSANPNEQGANEATGILSQVSNPSSQVRASADALMKEMASRLQKTEDDERKREASAEAHAHAEKMAMIDKATKIAVANARKPVYHIHWW